mgnify:CR=1 FL=1
MRNINKKDLEDKLMVDFATVYYYLFIASLGSLRLLELLRCDDDWERKEYYGW